MYFQVIFYRESLIFTVSRRKGQLRPVAKFIVADCGDKVDSGIGVNYIPPSQGQWIWLLASGNICRLEIEGKAAQTFCAADFALLNLPKGKSLGRSKPATSSYAQALQHTVWDDSYYIQALLNCLL